MYMIDIMSLRFILFILILKLYEIVRFNRKLFCIDVIPRTAVQ